MRRSAPFTLILHAMCRSGLGPARKHPHVHLSHTVALERRGGVERLCRRLVFYSTTANRVEEPPFLINVQPCRPHARSPGSPFGIFRSPFGKNCWFSGHVHTARFSELPIGAKLSRFLVQGLERPKTQPLYCPGTSTIEDGT
jgi:hypothetical protein